MSKSTPSFSGIPTVLPVLTEVATEVTQLEQLILDEEWLPANHVAKHGVRYRDRKDAMVPVHRGWQSLQATFRAGHDQTDLSQLRAALIELAGASVKFVADIDCHLSQNLPLPVDSDDPLTGQIEVLSSRRAGMGGEDDDEE